MSFDNRHKIDLPYWARPGLRFATRADDDTTFASLDDADDDSDDEDDDDDDEKDDADPISAMSLEELRAEHKRVQGALDKSAGSNKVKRDRLKKLSAELDEARRSKPAKTDDDDKPDVEAIKAQAREEARAEGNTRTIKAEARGALRGLGLPADQVADVVNMLDLSDVEVDDDGNVEGIDDAITAHKAKFPQLYPVVKRSKRSVAGESDRSGEGASKKPLTASEQQARIIRGH